MSKRRVQLVILCEDRQHSAFARRFAEASGWEKRQIQVIRTDRVMDTWSSLTASSWQVSSVVVYPAGVGLTVVGLSPGRRDGP